MNSEKDLKYLKKVLNKVNTNTLDNLKSFYLSKDWRIWSWV